MVFKYGSLKKEKNCKHKIKSFCTDKRGKFIIVKLRNLYKI